jgi:hypothetical protein
MTFKLQSACLIALAALLVAEPAYGQQQPAPATAPAEEPVAPGPPAADAALADEGLAAAEAILDDADLESLRGGETVILTSQTMMAITTGNVIHGDYIAGSVTLSDLALSNFNGLGNILINTGGQVSLQTGMNVTVNVGD